MNKVTLAVFLFIYAAAFFCFFGCNANFTFLGFPYSGAWYWDSSANALVLSGSGSINGFFWNPPQTVSHILIKKNVTVTGAFYFTSSCLLEGEDSNTSVIYGTPEQRYCQNRNINPQDYNAVFAGRNATVRVRNLKSLDPKGFHFSGFDNGAVLIVDHVRLVDDRGGDQNNSDGFCGADGSSISDSYINTGDDSLKLYYNTTVANVVIDMQHNGAPVQLGWNPDQKGDKACTLNNLTVNGIDAGSNYNLGVISWMGGGGSRTLTMNNCSIHVTGAKLFYLLPAGLTTTVNMAGASIIVSNFGSNRTSGTITINGTTNQTNIY